MGLLDDAIREHLELKRRRGADATEISRQETDALGPVRRSAEGVPDLSDLPAAPVAQAPIDEPGEAATSYDPPWEEETHVVPAAQPAYEPPPVPPATAPPAFGSHSPEPAHELPPVPAPPAHELYAARESPSPDPPSPAHEPPAPQPDPDFDPFPELADEPEPEPEPHPSAGQSLLARFRRGRKAAEGPAADDDPPPTAVHRPPPASDEPPPPIGESPYPPLPAQEPDVVPAGGEPEVEDLLEETPEFLEETPEHDRLWFEQRPPRDFDFDG